MSQTHFIYSVIWAGIWPLKGYFYWDTEVKFHYYQIFDFSNKPLFGTKTPKNDEDYPKEHFAYP